MRNKEVKPKRKLLTIGAFMFVCAFFAMTVSSMGASLWGAELYALEKEISDIKKDNRLIKSRIVEGSSLSRVYENSAEFGFVKPLEIVYIKAETSVAEARQ